MRGFKPTLVLLSLISIIACRDSTDFDPYFTPTNIISSSYGPSNITRTILQDSNGTVWFATWQGIIKYDGEKFTNLSNKEGLRRHRVFTILEDRKGNIWFGTIGAGLYKYDGENFSNLTTDDGLIHNDVTNLMEDRAGNLWIGGLKGISRYDGKTFENFTTSNNDVYNNDINVIVEDEDNRFWIGSRGYAMYFDGETFQIIASPENKTFVNVRSIIKDRNGNLWLGGNDGLWQYDGEQFKQFKKAFVGYIFEDRAGNIWTSSELENSYSWALSRYDNAQLANDTLVPTIVSEEYRAMYFGITEDKDGGIWLGSLNGACRFENNTKECFEKPVENN